MMESASLMPTRQSLLSRLKDLSDQKSWKDFFDTYWKLIYKAAAGAGLNDAEAQDVVQETVLSVVRSMPSFEYNVEKSFRGWLRQVTGWRIKDRLRQRERESKVQHAMSNRDARNQSNEPLVDPISQTLEEIWNQEWETNLIEAATEKVKRQVDPKMYQVFDLHVFKKWPVSRVAETLGISSTRVHYATHQVSKLIKKEIAKLRSQPFPV